MAAISEVAGVAGDVDEGVDVAAAGEVAATKWEHLPTVSLPVDSEHTTTIFRSDKRDSDDPSHLDVASGLQFLRYSFTDRECPYDFSCLDHGRQ
mmetsp:Transcript_24743/g.62095  ORF Transcript_24743/g.62095 Transcript_24743/m.62095 type:complete len:94 (-) Transcript_24743:26-307(-)